MHNQPNSAFSSAVNGHTTAVLPAANGNATLTNGFSQSSIHPIFPGSSIDKSEFVRLLLQGLQDAGFKSSAQALASESGHSFEDPFVATFRKGVLSGQWHVVDEIIQTGKLDIGDDAATVKFLIGQQKFLEALDAADTKQALTILRNDLAPLKHNAAQLHTLSSYMMSSGSADLRSRSGWSGTGHASRKRLLDELQQCIPSTVMMPERRLATLLEQAQAYQRSQCFYHTSDRPISLLTDHTCDPMSFPSATTHVLAEHNDEVWRVEFSHNGRSLATASKDRSVIIWRVGDFAIERVIPVADSADSISTLAWSPDDTKLLVGIEKCLKVFNVATGKCECVLDQHTERVGGVAWFPDGKTFVSGGMDSKLCIWTLDGLLRNTWTVSPYRIVDLAISPDGRRLVAIGEHTKNVAQSPGPRGIPTGSVPVVTKDRRVIVFDATTGRPEHFFSAPNEITCVTISDDSRFALVNQAPDEVSLYDLEERRLARRYRGQVQGNHIIRSCFGGLSKGVIVSGSEDSNIYLWHKDTGGLIRTLRGHGTGSVNAVAWNPTNGGMFASASDDRTIRIWQASTANSASNKA